MQIQYLKIKENRAPKGGGSQKKDEVLRGQTFYTLAHFNQNASLDPLGTISIIADTSSIITFYSKIVNR